MVVITISTVGYSEKSGVPVGNQVVSILVILFGISAAAYTFGSLAQLALEGELERAFGKRKMSKEIGKLKQHVIICGFGRLGQDLAVQLKHRSIPFVVVDIDEEKMELVQEMEALAIHGDATSESILEQANLKNARAIITALPSDAENVFITLTARNLRPDNENGIQIIAKSEQESSCRKLRQAGADKIVMPHRVGARQMERMISRPNTADLVELFAETTHQDMELDEIFVGTGSPWINKTLKESQIKQDFNLLVIGIMDGEGHLKFNPASSHKIQANDTLMVIGEVNDINRMKTTNAH